MAEAGGEEETEPIARGVGTAQKLVPGPPPVLKLLGLPPVQADAETSPKKKRRKRKKKRHRVQEQTGTAPQTSAG